LGRSGSKSQDSGERDAQTLSGDLGVSVDEGMWVITVFSAANAVSIPLTVWLTQWVEQVMLFVAAVLLFVVSSAAYRLAHIFK
jgi:DHA2 family multidrug resistance protein